MPIFLATVAIFALALLAMAVGVIVSNRCIQGSCGGLANMRDKQGRSMCEGCTTPPEECAASMLKGNQDPIGTSPEEESLMKANQR